MRVFVDFFWWDDNFDTSLAVFFQTSGKSGREDFKDFDNINKV
jgi:hypothetical protein